MKATKKITFAVSVIGLFTLGDTFAQSGYFEDVLRYSQIRSTGSARVMGIGGAQTSLGGDVSNIHSNPAGLGFFRRSEVSFTGSYGNWATETNFLGQIQENSTSNFALPNLSLVMSKVKDPLERGDWRGGSFGISINRSQLFTNDFNYFSNRRGSSSLLDYYSDDYNSFGEPAVGDAFGLPLDVRLIVNNNGNFEKDSNYALGNPFQDEFIETEGTLSQITFAYGGNYKNKVFLGGSVGVTSVNFLSTKTFNEEFLDDNEINALYYSLRETLLQSGTGVNVNLGVIYKPMDNINLGLTFSSPTWTRINEEFDADIFAEFYDLNGQLESDEEAISDLYLTPLNMRSPMKLGVGGTYFFNKNGFITADIDFIDYSSMNLSSPDFSLEDSNRDIKTYATRTINYRGGAEYRFDLFRIRAGAAIYGDPMQDSEFDRTMIQYSGGIGMRLPKFYVDFSMIQNSYDSFYTSYPGAEIASINNKQLTGLITVGINF